jgi:hypothetical protein
MFKKIQGFAADVWSRVKPKRLEQSLLADNRGTNLIEWLGIIILGFVIVGSMALMLINTTVGRGQEVNNWINSL